MWEKIPLTALAQAQAVFRSGASSANATGAVMTEYLDSLIVRGARSHQASSMGDPHRLGHTREAPLVEQSE